MSSTTKKLVSALADVGKKKTSSYDTQAEVKRIENGTAWVHIPGGVDETPVKLTINASVGDSVQVRVSGGKAFLVGNKTAPPTDDRVAIQATYIANTAQTTAESASNAATTAWTYADTAKAAATSANQSANSALTQLGVVEQVVDTLNWITEHGTYTLTSDTTVDASKIYFIYNSTTNTYEPVSSPTDDDISTYYELSVDEAVSNYVATHLALTDAGLWVLPSDRYAEHELVDSDGDNIIDSDGDTLVDWSIDPQNASGYKVLLSDTGMTVYNGEGTAVAFYGETATIGTEAGNHVYIDNDSVDIMDGTATLASFGSTVKVGPDDGSRIVIETDSIGLYNGEHPIFEAATGWPRTTSGIVYHAGDGVETLEIDVINQTGGVADADLVVTFSRYDRVLQAVFQLTSEISVAAGANIYEGQIVTNHYEPSAYVAGVGYYGSHAIIGRIKTDGSIVVRNASSSAVTISDGVVLSFTYIEKNYNA